jgi:hypothetical protein
MVEMVHVDSGRLTRSLIGVGLLAAGLACHSTDPEAANGAGNPVGPAALANPSPVPTPEPTPTPRPTPKPSKSGIRVEVIYFGSQECRRGVGPSETGALRVGCSVEVRALRKDANGNEVPERRTGIHSKWRILEGRDLVTLPWDENPWRRWLTAVEPGHYRLAMDLTLPEGDVIRGELEGDTVK